MPPRRNCPKTVTLVIREPVTRTKTSFGCKGSNKIRGKRRNLKWICTKMGNCTRCHRRLWYCVRKLPRYKSCKVARVQMYLPYNCADSVQRFTIIFGPRTPYTLRLRKSLSKRKKDITGTQQQTTSQYRQRSNSNAARHDHN